MSEHYNCHVCGPERKYCFYRNYSDLNKHFKQWHYLCMDDHCLQKNFVVFGTIKEMELHIAQVHSNAYDARLGKQQQKQMSAFNIQTITNFQFGGANDKEDDYKSSQRQEKPQRHKEDKIGRDFERQFLSQKKEVVKGISEHRDQSLDEPIDFRLFQSNANQAEHNERTMQYVQNQNMQKQMHNKKVINKK